MPLGLESSETHKIQTGPRQNCQISSWFLCEKPKSVNFGDLKKNAKVLVKNQFEHGNSHN